PGIDVAETRRARLSGFRRGFCMWSIHHRGSEADPGLVLALEPHRGAMCEGLAIRAAAPRVALEELRARELISSAYEEAQVDLICEQGTRIPALAYVINTAHRQYAPDLSLDDQARIIAHAHGGRGPNHEYLTATAKSLHDLDIGDANIDALVTRVQQIKADH
ncbi:MAG: gamma-glutamylcyclotransferase, partial [Pseudomonadota bacterium]